MTSLQDGGGEGAKELEEFHSDRMKVVQLDVCSDEQVARAVEYVKDNLKDTDTGTVVFTYLNEDVFNQTFCLLL